MSKKINIKGLDKAEILAGLYNNSIPLGLGHIHFKDSDMTIEEANEELNNSYEFDYLHGRVMKVDISGDEVCPYLYDRDNGKGALENIVNKIRKARDNNETGCEHG